MQEPSKVSHPEDTSGILEEAPGGLQEELGADADTSSEDDTDQETPPPPKKAYKIPKITKSRSKEQISALRKRFSSSSPL
jgi:hypothetical protein